MENCKEQLWPVNVKATLFKEYGNCLWELTTRRVQYLSALLENKKTSIPENQLQSIQYLYISFWNWWLIDKIMRTIFFKYIWENQWIIYRFISDIIKNKNKYLPVLLIKINKVNIYMGLKYQKKESNKL